MSKRSGGKSAPRASAAKSDRGTGDGGRERESAALDARPVCATCGQVHKGCKAHTKHGPNAGKPCGANLRKGAIGACPKHGGNNPNQKAKAAERIEQARQEMLDLVEPLLARFRDIVADPDTTDADVIRVFREIANRVGLSERHVIVPGQPSKWDDMFEEGAVFIDRVLASGDDHRPLPSPTHTEEDLMTFQSEAQAEAWSELDAEDEESYRSRLDPFDGRTVQGEVVEESIFPPQPDTRGVPSEHDPLRWPYDRPPA